MITTLIERIVSYTEAGKDVEAVSVISLILQLLSSGTYG